MRSGIPFLVVAIGCAVSPATLADVPPARFAGCLAFQSRSDSLRPAVGGALGDSLPGQFIFRLTAVPVPTSRLTDSLGTYQVEYTDEYDTYMGGWTLHGDSLVIRFRGYGRWSDIGLTGRPDSLAGVARTATHQGFVQHAQLSARRVSCSASRAT